MGSSMWAVASSTNPPPWDELTKRSVRTTNFRSPTKRDGD